MYFYTSFDLIGLICILVNLKDRTKERSLFHFPQFVCAHLFLAVFLDHNEVCALSEGENCGGLSPAEEEEEDREMPALVQIEPNLVT